MYSIEFYTIPYVRVHLQSWHTYSWERDHILYVDAECKKGQLSHRLLIPNVPVVDIVTPKEEPQIFKIKLPDTSHLSMPIYSHVNNEECLAHIVAVLQVIEQKGLPKKCRVLAKAVVKWSEALKNLQEAAGSQDTVLTTVDVTARKMEIEQTQQMLQEAQKTHNKAITKLYEQLRNCCLAMHSPNGIASATRCTSVTHELQ